MSTSDPERGPVAVTFAELARLFHESTGQDEICAAVCTAAARLVDGVDHASIMVKERGGYRTVASSDDIAATADRLERELRDGPCVDAIESDAYQLDADIRGHSQWPGLAARLLAETPVRGMAGYRLMVDGRKTGALNLFSDTPNALTAQSADQGVVLAAFASVALGGSAHQAEARTLAEGLQSNREIGTAIGLLMAAHGLSAADAFETLRSASSHLNRKLVAVAREIVDKGPAPRG